MPHCTHRRSCPLHIRTVVLGVCLALWAAIAPAQAQWGIWGMMEQLKTPAMTSRTLKAYGEALQFTPEQKSSAEDIYFAYEREHRDFAKRFNDISRSIHDEYEYENDGDVDVWRDVWPKVNKSFIKKGMKLEKGIIEDLKAILTPEQLAHWPQVERTSRRKISLGWGGGAADKLDLIDLVEGLRLDESSSSGVAATLEQYAIDLDRELQARNKFIDDSVESWFALMIEYDADKWQKMFKDFKDINKRVGNVTARYRPIVQSTLPEAAAKEFDLRIKQTMYPKIYRKTHALMVFDAVEKLEGIDPSTLEGIKGIRESYDRDAGIANEKWANAMAEQDARQEEANDGNMWWGGGEEEPKVQEARAARHAIDKKAAAAVKALLTEEQRKKLPDRKWRPEWDMEGTAPLGP
ncbi:MAG: hypothetical protein H7210_09215 [Pyrinomonadaceae bacterium]|nr:hypothetical protein [Phycisphaerales bacterium]